MEHLALEVFDRVGTGSKYAVLEPDATITITDTSEIFADGDVWSYGFTLNVYANAHLFGTAGEIHGSRLHEQLNKRKARLWLEGVPLHLGYLKLGDEAEVDAEGNTDITFESGQKTFGELIEGAKANQVPMMSDVLIGMALWRKRWTTFRVKLSASLSLDSYTTFPGTITHDGEEWFGITYNGEEEGNSVQEYPRMVYPKGHFSSWKAGEPDWDDNLVNTDHPYTEDEDGTPTYPYCNVALCYQKQGYLVKDENGVTKPNYSGEPEAQRGYEYMPANRVNSAPNFYVIYWMRCLMKHLGIHIDENQMLDVEDLRRLFFVNTSCAYEEPNKLTTVDYNARYGRYRSGTLSDYMKDDENLLLPEYINPERNINKEASGGAGKNIVSEDLPSNANVIGLTVKIIEVEKWDGLTKASYKAGNDNFHLAYATSDCFPNVDISEVINAIESGFGVRLLFSNDYKRVRIVLLRNVFRSEEVQDITCEIVDEDVKVENNIRGFRMTYGNTEDTHFYYKGFADMLPHKKELWIDDSDKHDYSKWNLNANYANIIHKVSAFDKTCYVTANTGDSYIIKVDKDAKRYDDLHPSLFEGAGFMDAEDGDCTGEEETIETINVNFAPAIVNDLNYEQERDGQTDKPRYALFVDETMRPRRPVLQEGTDYNDPTTVYPINGEYGLYGDKSAAKGMMNDGLVKPGEFAIRSDMYVSAQNVTAEIGVFFMGRSTIKFDFDGHINEGYRLYLQDNFEPNDDGISPIEKHDWGLTMGIMRGSGGDAYVNYSDDPDDGEDNQTWDIVPGSSVTAHPDTCDSYGNEWDYNGQLTITTPDEAIGCMTNMFHRSNFLLTGRTQKNYLTACYTQKITTNQGVNILLLFAARTADLSPSTVLDFLPSYASQFEGKSIDEIYSEDAQKRSILIEAGSTLGRKETLLHLQRIAYAGAPTPFRIDNGVGADFGRFSLKLRAEKPNPYFNPKAPESGSNRRYLEITNKNLRQRGLCDQFYKEYSKFIREARIVKRTVHMTLAQLLTIDKTKRVRVGDVTGFIRKMQYTVSNETGLGNVILEIMYI